MVRPSASFAVGGRGYGGTQGQAKLTSGRELRNLMEGAVDSRSQSLELELDVASSS